MLEDSTPSSTAGVPYAKAPVGHLRWKKPISWWSDGEWCGRKERRRAHKYAKPCFHVDPETRKFVGMEDCLYLNVWSPRLDTSRTIAESTENVDCRVVSNEQKVIEINLSGKPYFKEDTWSFQWMLGYV
ncbi:neurotactin [Trichonephila inaurata madagascariensis]|uniref:Neurotactin n=1 Tax=Trichonephila inaurata madagascariensis TaxID=2747483 RepID=A0A8X6I3U4_9ARAC|nr:neurotactin [Trichonephila inaurata madagascariensis]